MDASESTEATDPPSYYGKLHLRDLNFDVIYHICSYLHVTDLIACQFLSKEFWEAATKIFERKYQHLHLDWATVTNEQLSSTYNKVNIATLLVKRIGCWVTSLTISRRCYFEDLNQLIAEYCPQLIELNLHGDHWHMPALPVGSVMPFKNVTILKIEDWNAYGAMPDDAIIQFYINSCPKLEKLTLENMNISRFNIFCGTQLKELSLHRISDTSSQPQEDLDINTFSKLELLSLSLCSRIFDVLPQLVTSGVNLKHLSLATRTCNVAWICRSFSHLEQFAIELNRSFSEVMDIGKLSKLKKLKILFLEYKPSGDYQSDHWINKLIQSLANRNILQEFELSVANDLIQITVDTIEACRAFTVLKNMTVLKRTFGGRRGKDSLWSMCSAIDCLEHLNIVYEEEEWFLLQALLKDKSNLRLGRATSNNWEYLASKTIHQSIGCQQHLQIGCVEEEWASLQALVKNMPNLRSLRLISIPDFQYFYMHTPLMLVINYVDVTGIKFH